MGYRLPLFDIEISAEKQSPYSKMSQNELALQFYSAGFFNPQMADQALACLDMMDFDRKQFIMQKISQNGGMYQQMLMMQQQLMQLTRIVGQDGGTNPVAQPTGGGAEVAAQPQAGQTRQPEKTTGGESSVTKNARQRVADATSPT